MAAMENRPLFKVSFHLGGLKGAGLLTGDGGSSPLPPGYAPVCLNHVYADLFLHSKKKNQLQP